MNVNLPEELRERYEELVATHGGAGYLQLAGSDYLFRKPSPAEAFDIGRAVLNVATSTSTTARAAVYRRMLLTLVDDNQQAELVKYVNERLADEEARQARDNEIIAAASNFFAWLGDDAVVTPVSRGEKLEIHVDDNPRLDFRVPTAEELARSAKSFQVGNPYQGIRELINRCVHDRPALKVVLDASGPLCLAGIYQALVDAYDDSRGNTEVRAAGF